MKKCHAYHCITPGGFKNFLKKYKYFDWFYLLYHPSGLSWLEHGANNTQVVGLILIRAIHLRVGLDVLYGSLPSSIFYEIYVCLYDHKH